MPKARTFITCAMLHGVCVHGKRPAENSEWNWICRHICQSMSMCVYLGLGSMSAFARSMTLSIACELPTSFRAIIMLSRLIWLSRAHEIIDPTIRRHSAGWFSFCELCVYASSQRTMPKIYSIRIIIIINARMLEFARVGSEWLHGNVYWMASQWILDSTATGCCMQPDSVSTRRTHGTHKIKPLFWLCLSLRMQMQSSVHGVCVVRVLSMRNVPFVKCKWLSKHLNICTGIRQLKLNTKLFNRMLFAIALDCITIFSISNIFGFAMWKVVHSCWWWWWWWYY